MPVARRTLLALALAAPLGARAGDVPLQSEDQKALYTAGAQVAETLKGNLDFLELSKEELATFVAGVNDGFSGKPRLDLKDQGQQQRLDGFRRNRMQKLLERETGEAQKFIDSAAKEKGAVKTDSGLIYKEVTAGKGDSPSQSDTVKVQYTGKLRDGSVFDSSVERGQPAEFPLNGIIPCWAEALQRMKPGGKAHLVCPASIAYGTNGAPPKIKPGAALAFDVELISVSKDQAAPAAKMDPHSGMSMPPNHP
jgi:FKBP-type peptidyl-prolyl cis-trans isomerase FkpA